MKDWLFLLIIFSQEYMLKTSLRNVLSIRFVFWTFALYMNIFAKRIIRSLISSEYMCSLSPKIINLSFTLKLFACPHLLSMISKSWPQNFLTTSQLYKTCCIVSLCLLQKEHKSVWSSLYLETDLLVVRILCNTLNWSHLNLVSFVVNHANLRTF